MDDTDAGDLWLGTCDCGVEHAVLDAELRAAYPHDETWLDTGDFVANCSCGGLVDLHVQSAKVIAFTEMMILPPASGCPQCGIIHEQDMPHNPQSLVYQYQFRQAEARAGREERWPTWRDAMAHCPPDVQKAWTAELAKHGVIV